MTDQGDTSARSPRRPPRSSTDKLTSSARMSISLLDSEARQQQIERVTIALIPQVVDDLRRLQERSNLSKTDIINRAITIYEFIDAQLNAGCDLIVRDSRTGETQLIRLL